MSSALQINSRILKNDLLYFTAQTGPKAHSFNNKQSRNSRFSNTNPTERHWQLTGHVTEGGW